MAEPTRAALVHSIADVYALTREQLTLLARNSIEASFLEPAAKRRWLESIDAYAAIN